jgi:acyl-CoA reductase-like NAD-dependent aldehyde dehydrogenase
VLHPAASGAAGTAASFIGVDVTRQPRLFDGAIFQGQRAVVRCVNPGSLAAFERSWHEEVRERPARGGLAAVLGAGNVTGLAAADAISQIFEYGRAVTLKLHPLHEPLAAVIAEALGPLVAADLLGIVTGGTDVAQAVVAAPQVTHVHLTGGQAAFEAIVWGTVGPRPPAAVPVLTKPITCELGNVTPWIVVPGRYTRREIESQADLVAASIANNTSFNCIATKCLVTCASWDQRAVFLDRVHQRLAALAPRPAWYPGAAAAWEAVTGSRPPADGRLPWTLRTGVDPDREPHWLSREWFTPVAVEVPLAAAGIDEFCGRVSTFVQRLPGSLAATVTAPDRGGRHEARRIDLLVEHLPYGVVARNQWTALAYALGSVPWGGYPGGTLHVPESGIGRVHDPLLLPLVHNTILTAPLSSWLSPPWAPWHRSGDRLARGVAEMYAAIARGGTGLGSLLQMLPAVLAG